eukprot:CAMPEP_0202836198 /NCGR_PEP_ID=MMETSP1389-20130828/40225_1 /ASSEMBLY_ACC=CAM_ASM_000865 /TAXON_ID=302021 /ORGANISM="Rhodomonas sp., Strain CCMP768" /LENGTH=106 /DNA_ID=CAMNT_0049511913 /DNA_START=63 /DNA_END=383 /DNA_ORIENTATION=-
MGWLSWIPGLGGGPKEVDTSGELTPEQHVARATLSQADKMKQVYQKQLASKYLNDLASTVTDKCFLKCAQDGMLDTSDQGCSAMCCDRYLDTFELVRRTLQTRNRR